MRLAGSPSYLAETAALRLLELGRAPAAVDLLAGELERRPTASRGCPAARAASRALVQVGRIADAARPPTRRSAPRPKLADATTSALSSRWRADGPAAIPDLEPAAALDAEHLEARKALAMLRHAQGDDAATRRLLARCWRSIPPTTMRATISHARSQGDGRRLRVDASVPCTVVSVDRLCGCP